MRTSPLLALLLSSALLCACSQGSGTSSGGAGAGSAASSGSSGSGGEGGGDLFPPPPEGSFSCGDQYCSLATDYCQENVPGPKGDSTYACVALPAACQGAPQCSACFDMTIDHCGSGTNQDCEDRPDGSILFTCIYP